MFFVNKKEKVIYELISAQSSLNNIPSPIENPKGAYLSDTDKYAEIAYSHIVNALSLLLAECKNES